MNHKRHQHLNPGVGATSQLSLRVSVATLVRVLFEHPGNNELMLALERKATALKAETGYAVEVLAQPLGGAIRIHDLNALQDLIGDFHFDSEESHSKQDFRLFVRPSDWETIQQFCLLHLSTPEDSVIESDPRRELVEELADALNVHLMPDQYILKPATTLVEEHPTPTTNRNAKGYRTARVYRIFEARISDLSLSHAILRNSDRYSSQRLCELALEDAERGGHGRANAVLALPMEHLREMYSSLSPEVRNSPISFRADRLDETVAAVLPGVTVPKYRTV